MEAGAATQSRRAPIPVGAQFGKWTVESSEIRESRGRRERVYFCRCACGNTLWQSRGNLEAGKSTQCQPCARRDNNNIRRASYTRLGLPRDHARRLAERFYAIRSRCEGGTKRDTYRRRGIRCLFGSVVDFLAHVTTLEGWDNPALSLDRIDNDGHYAEGNLRFVSAVEQMSNTSVNRSIEYNGQRYAGAVFHRLFAPRYRCASTVLRKIREGHTAEEIIAGQDKCRGRYRSGL